MGVSANIAISHVLYSSPLVMLFMHIKLLYPGDKFDVLEGSEINMSKAVNIPKYNAQREELLAKGDIAFENGKHILKVTLTFNTPSGASDFVLGGSTNGWVEWKNAEGKTLDELYRRKE